MEARRRLLIEVGHPAHVHQFKYLYRELKLQNWEILFAAKEKEMVLDLLKKLNLPFVTIGRNQRSMWKKLANLPLVTYRLFKVVRHYKPDLLISRISPHSCLIGFLARRPHIAFADTEKARLLDQLIYRFCQVILTPVSFRGSFGSKQIPFAGYKELAYLHPNYFQPKVEEIAGLGLQTHEPFVIIRFVAWNAHHDIGQHGLDLASKRDLLTQLLPLARVFISSETELESEFQAYRLSLAPDKIHHALALASLVISEGATLAAECAMLGTPAIYVNSIKTGYIQELEQYGLLTHFNEGRGVVEKALGLLKNSQTKAEFQAKRQHMLTEKIDTTSFWTWFVSRYPQSVEIIKNSSTWTTKFSN